MAFEVELTSAKQNPLALMYRVPESDYYKGMSRPLITINLPARAFRYKVAFSDELHFNAFKEQNISLFDNGTLLLGSGVKEKDAIKTNEKLANDEVKSVRASKEKVVSNIEKSVSNKNTTLKLNVEKAD